MEVGDVERKREVEKKGQKITESHKVTENRSRRAMGLCRSVIF